MFVKAALMFEHYFPTSVHPRARPGATAAPAVASCLNPIAGGNRVAVGDAARCQDPLSASGIAQALDTGIKAARTSLRDRARARTRR